MTTTTIISPFRNLWTKGVPLFAAIVSLTAPHAAKAATQNDDIFPPATAAAPFVSFDGKGFVLNGRRTFIASGSIHYPRVPKEEWRDSLLKLKRAGFNTVETYVFWNFHEATEGKFDFSTDRHDLGAFLDIAKQVGLYAIVRVGPYECSEWKNGGFPEWLVLKPGVEMRRNNRVYLDAVDAYFNKMLPIISARQIQKGGNVILVQLENEMPGQGWRFWGTQSDGPHFQHLLDLAHANGLEVPMYFSGLHHSHDPAPTTPIDSTTRLSPWMSTELWTTWFEQYGIGDEYLMSGERHPWRVLEEGGNGFNLYMFQGGTTFGFNNFDNDTAFGDKGEKGRACYDFGAPVGQTGNTRELYLRMKRLGYFADTFSPILADSTNATSDYQGFAVGATITARTSPAGTLVFLDNPATSPTVVSLKSGIRLTLAPGEIMACPLNIPLVDGVSVSEADTRVLGIIKQGKTTTIVCYGEPGETGRITFGYGTTLSVAAPLQGGVSFVTKPVPSIDFVYPESGIVETDLKCGESLVRVLTLSKAGADETWIVDTVVGRRIVTGAPYLGEFSEGTPGKIDATVDCPWATTIAPVLTVYGSEGRVALYLHAPPKQTPAPLKLSSWKMCADSAPLAPSLDDSQWLTGPDGAPTELGADSDATPFAWYRTTVTATVPVATATFARIGDRATFFVDGNQEATYNFKVDKKPTISLKIPSGQHQLAVFVAQTGRNKFAGKVGNFDSLGMQKGLRGPVVFDAPSTSTTPWKMRGCDDLENYNPRWSASKDMNGTPTYFRANFDLVGQPEIGAVYRLDTSSLSFGAVWLNGQNVGVYPEIVKGCPGLWLPSCWMKAGANTLTIFDERGMQPDKVAISLELSASRHRITSK